MEHSVTGRTIKLLIYAHFFAPSIGGVETSVFNLAQGLAALVGPARVVQFEITVVTQTPARGFDDRQLAFPVIRQPSAVSLFKLISQCDVMHLAGPSLVPQLLGFLTSKPTVLEHHGYQAICPNGHLLHEPERSICPGHFLGGRPLECLKCQMVELPFWKSLVHMFLMVPRYLLARSSSVNIAISNHVLRRHDLPNSKTIYYGIEECSASVGRVAQLDSSEMCFAYVGRLSPEKGVPILLKAISLLNEEGLHFKVKLVGDGPQRAEIREIIESERIADRVSLTGFLEGNELSQAMDDVSAVVMPSVCEETAGLAAIEQMMRGRLVIASDIGGLAEVVSNAGLLTPAGDAEALAARMKQVIQDPGLIDTIGKTSRSRAQALFLKSRMVNEHAEVYRQLVQR